MPFKKTFEKHVNKNLHDEEDRGQPSDIEDMDIKTQPAMKSREEEAQDYEVHDKKDVPPRFSTLFGPAPRMSRSPSPQRQYYAAPPPPPPRRKSGIWMPWSLFILLAVMLFLESTILFTYTVIGLYNNTPSRIFAWAGTGNGNAPASLCEMQKDVATQPAAVNFAPNFVMPPAAAPAVQAAPVTVTVTPDSDYLSALISKMMSTTTTANPTTSTSTSSTSSVDTSSAAAALASEIASMLATAHPTSTSAGVLTLTTNVGPVVTKTETIPPSSQSTPTSLAINPSAKTAPTTLLSLPFLPPVVAGNSETVSPRTETSAAPPPSTTVPPPETTAAPPPATSATTTKNGSKMCVPAAGAMVMNCDP